jgi:hypothetical protein
MITRSHEFTSKARGYNKGQRLYCPNCGLEIEIINPCTGFTTGQVLQCCGREMTPEVGVTGNMESES